MEYILGLLTGVAFFILLAITYYIGYRTGKKPPPKTELSEDEKRKAEKLHQDFVQLMNYDVTTALKRKKVT